MICANKYCWRCVRFKKKWKGWGHIGNGMMIKLNSIIFPEIKSKLDNQVSKFKEDLTIS